MELEKILTISAADYCASVGKKLSDYTLKGIHSYDKVSTKDATSARKSEENIILKFKSEVPNKTEVVVGFTHSLGGFGINTFGSRNEFAAFKFCQYASGTALIPK